MWQFSQNPLFKEVNPTLTFARGLPGGPPPQVELEHLPELPAIDHASALGVSSSRARADNRDDFPTAGQEEPRRCPNILRMWLYAERHGLLLGAIWLLLRMTALLFITLLMHGVLLGLELCVRGTPAIETDVILFSDRNRCTFLHAGPDSRDVRDSSHVAYHAFSSGYAGGYAQHGYYSGNGHGMGYSGAGYGQGPNGY